MLKIYFIMQNCNNDYDTYDSAIVVAKNELQAQKTLPFDYRKYLWLGKERAILAFNDHVKEFSEYYNQETYSNNSMQSWVPWRFVRVKYIANLPVKSEYKAGDVILGSFNAG